MVHKITHIEEDPSPFGVGLFSLWEGVVETMDHASQDSANQGRCWESMNYEMGEKEEMGNHAFRDERKCINS
jgi:hypothetical protein